MTDHSNLTGCKKGKRDAGFRIPIENECCPTIIIIIFVALVRNPTCISQTQLETAMLLGLGAIG